MNHAGRVSLVTAGLIAAGAVGGAIAGLITIAVALALTGEFSAFLDFGIMAIVAIVGALFGGVLFPGAIWLFLRRVPFGLALLGMVTGTVVGGAVAWALAGAEQLPIGTGVAGALIGFVTSCVGLRVGVPRLQRGTPAA